MTYEDLPSIDYDFRPKEYTECDRSIYSEYSCLDGDERINKVRRILIRQGPRRQWANQLACEELSESHRDWLGSATSYIGLDPIRELKQSPVIAVIQLRSTLSDSYWISAEKTETGYQCKINHDLNDSPVIQPFFEKKEPLTLLELITLIDESYIEGDVYGSRGLVKGMWECCLSEGGEVPEKAVASTVVESIFYPNLERHYEEEGRRFVEEFN